MFNWLMLIIMFYILYNIQLPLFSIKKNIVRISFFLNGMVFYFCGFLSAQLLLENIQTNLKRDRKNSIYTILIYFHGKSLPPNLSLLSTSAPSSFCWLLQLLRPIHLLKKELSWICPTALLVKKVSICKRFISFS